jgi:hypothetical protein
VGRRMELNIVRKMASLSTPLGTLLSLVLLLGSGSGSTFSGSALAQQTSPSSDPATTTSSTSSPSFQPPSSSVSEGQPPETGVKTELPMWLWFVLGTLTVWNLVLSYLVWKNFENFDRKTYTNEKKLKALDSKNIALDHRIDRRSAAIDELNRKFESLESNLSRIQEQRSPSSKDDNTALQAKKQSKSYEYSPASHADFSQSSSHLSRSATSTEPWDSIVQNYNYSPQILETYIVEKVSETEESLTNRRNSSNAPVLLKHTNNANYWIFNGEDQNSWLVPKSDLKLTPISYDTFQALFECQDYQPNLKLQIMKPAKVSYNASTGIWELEAKGQVQFTR